MWMEAISGKEKLRVQKYPEKCGRGLAKVAHKELFVLENSLVVKPKIKISSNIIISCSELVCDSRRVRNNSD